MDTRHVVHSCGCTEDWFDRAIRTTQPESVEKWDRVRRDEAVEGDWHLIDPFTEAGGSGGELLNHSFIGGAWKTTPYDWSVMAGYGPKTHLSS